MRGPLHAPLVLYPFRFRDTLTGKWVRARYVAERHEIAARRALLRRIQNKSGPNFRPTPTPLP